MNDKTTVIITILIVLIAGMGVYAESFLNSSNKPVLINQDSEKWF